MNAEQNWQFVDTNLLVYAFDRSAGSKHEQAKQLLAQFWRGRNGCISVQVLQEFYAVAMRKQLLAKREELSSILEDLAHWRVYAPLAGDVLAAVRLHQRYQISFWDAMILHSAAQLGCRTVWSEDLNSGQAYHDIRVLNPFHRNTP